MTALLLEASQDVGEAWRRHYDRLHLHTHKGGSHLPGLAFPADYPRYASREQFIAYLEGYSRHFGLRPALGVAIGNTRVPVRPTWPGLDTFKGPVNVIPRELFGLPILVVSALLRPFPTSVADSMSRPMLALSIGDITTLGLRRPRYGGLEEITRHGRLPLIDVGTLALVRAGHVKIAPGIERFSETSAVFEGGATESFEVVVLATGYRPALEDFLPSAPDLCDEHGGPAPRAK